MPQRKTESAPTNEPPFALAPPEAPLPFVDYDFPDPAHTWNGLILVGEAPGREEARLGHPFVGRSGQLLNDMLVKAKIERKACLIANVFRRQPPGNKVAHFFLSRRASKEQGIEIEEKLGSFGSAWCRKDFAQDIDILKQTIEKQQPLLIIALGRTPLWALTGEGALLNKVGQKLPCRLAQGLIVLPTFHPSFILRGNWGLQPQWLEHFEAATRHVAKK